MTTREVFFSIAKCELVDRCLTTNEPHPCREIVESQARRKDYAEVGFQVPEPWVGEIDKARVLFVSSNPSIGDDTHATRSSSDDDVWESHHLAFGGGKKKYISEGIRTTRPDGTIIKTVRYWVSIRARARELLGNDVKPGRDYALTEVVHCKSEREVGVDAAVDTCEKKHLDNVLSVAAATVVVAVGSFAQRRLIGPAAGPGALIERELGGKPRLIAALPHPASFAGPKTFAGTYSEADMRRLIAAVN